MTEDDFQANNQEDIDLKTNDEIELEIQALPPEKREAARKKRKKLPPKQSALEQEPPEIPRPLPPDPDAEPMIPKKMTMFGRLNYFQEDVVTQGLLNASTRLKYFGIGGIFDLVEERENPTGMRISAQFGIPIFKEKFDFPIYRSIETEYYKGLLNNHFKIFAGFDFVPTYFVNVPEFGEELQVFQNDFLWVKGGFTLAAQIKERDFYLRFAYLKSIVSKSSENQNLSASKFNVLIYGQIKKSHAVELNYQSLTGTGLIQIKSQNLSLAYIYKFEN